MRSSFDLSDLGHGHTGAKLTLVNFCLLITSFSVSEGANETLASGSKANSRTQIVWSSILVNADWQSCSLNP